MMNKNAPAKIAFTKHDGDLASIIWPSFKETLEEKHGETGARGNKGEQFALKLIEDKKLFLGTEWAVSCQDCLFQIMGCDIVIRNNEKYYFVDVKHGSSSLYFDKEVGGKDGWFFTVRGEVLNKPNKTDIILHLGPKGDVYTWYPKNEMKMLLGRLSNRQTVRVYRKDWPDFIRTNL